MLESLNGVQEGGGGRVGGRYNGGFGTGPPLPPKETHRYRIALPGLTGQNSPTIGGRGRGGERKREGGKGKGRNFRPSAARFVVEGPTRRGLQERERERERSGASSLPSSRADPIN